MNQDALVVIGEHIKVFGDGRVGGYLVRFTDAEHPDLQGDFFTKDTDFDIETGDRVTVYYNHGYDPVLKQRKLGRGTVRLDDVGVWVEAQLEMRDEYERAVYRMAEAGKQGWSSGTLPNLVEREPVKHAMWIKRWPLGKDASLTPTPAAGPEITRVTTLKSVTNTLAVTDAAFEALLPEAGRTPAAQSADAAVAEALTIELDLLELEQKGIPNVAEETEGVVAMPEPTVDPKVAVLEAKFAALEAKLAAEPPVNDPGIAGKGININSKTKRGDDETKAVVHYLRTGDEGAVKASNDTDMNIGTPADGGNAVPTGHYQGIIAKRDASLLAPLLGVMRIPGKGTTVNVPYESGSANAFVSTAEATNFDRDAPALGQKEFTLVKYTKKIQLSYELLEDEDSRIMTFLNDYVGRALALTHNALLIAEALANGTSVALGSVTAAAAGDPQTLVYTLKQQYAGGAQFVTRGATYMQLMKMTGDGFQYAETPGGTRSYALWGYPVQRDENLESPASGKKSVLFGNFGYMGLYEAPSLTFLRDPYSSADTGQINLFYYFRADYGVLLPEAILYGQHPTA